MVLEAHNKMVVFSCFLRSGFDTSRTNGYFEPIIVLAIMYYMQLGLLYWTRILNVKSIHQLGLNGNSEAIKFLIPIHMIIITFYILIIYSRYKLNKVLKWLITLPN